MTLPHRFAIATGLFVLAAVKGHPIESSDPNVKLGFDPAEFSETVRPKDDFFAYVNGPWIDSHEIPDNQPAIGTWLIQYERTQDQIRTIIEHTWGDAPIRCDDLDSSTIRNLYRSFVDTKSLEAQELAPIQEWIERVERLEAHDELPSIFGSLAQIGVEGLFRTLVFNDADDPSQLRLYFLQAGIGLPGRDYYLSEDRKQVTTRRSYQGHIRNLFQLAGWQEGEFAAEEILKLETRLATAHWSRVQNRDWQTLSANKFSLEAAEELIEHFRVKSWLKHAGVPDLDQVVLTQPSYFQTLSHIVSKTPIETWKMYLKLKVLKAFAPLLKASIRAEAFRFDGRTLRGQTQQKPRSQEGVEFVSDLVPDLIDRRYVETNYTDELATYTQEMIDRIRNSFHKSIEKSRWMSAATKKEALNKLKTMEAIVGRAERRRDYSAVETKPQELVKNVMNVRRFHHVTLMDTLNRPALPRPSRAKSQNVNGVYNAADNTFTLGVALLQPPMFTSDHAHNYGSLGASIGHEISHGFDDQGRKFTSDGRVSEWWTDDEWKYFQAATNALINQYDAYEPLPGLRVNGALTLGENISDLVGLRMAYRAFKNSKYVNAGSVMGFTPEQRFFIAYALFHRLKMSAPFLRAFVIRGPHAPVEYRVNGVLRNMPEFYGAFSVHPGDGMYLEAKKRVRVW